MNRYKKRLNELKNVADIIQDTLIDDIYNGKYTPGENITQESIAEKFGVSQAMINRDLKKIVSTFDPEELDEVFTSFYETDKKIARELSKMLYQGDEEQKVRASQLLLQLQKSFTELLESWNKKKKVAEEHNVNVRDYVFKIVREDSEEKGDENGNGKANDKEK